MTLVAWPAGIYQPLAWPVISCWLRLQCPPRIWAIEVCTTKKGKLIGADWRYIVAKRHCCSESQEGNPVLVFDLLGWPDEYIIHASFVMTLTSELVVVQTNGIRFPFLVLSDFLAGMWPRASRVGWNPTSKESAFKIIKWSHSPNIFNTSITI